MNKDKWRRQEQASRSFLYSFFVMVSLAAIIMILMFVIPTCAPAASGTFSWLPANDEGLTKGYEVLWGSATRDYDTVSTAAMPEVVDGRHYHTINNLPEGIPLFFAAIAYDDSGDTIVKSDYSEEVENTFPITRPDFPGVVQGYQFEGTIQGVMIPITE